MLIRSARAPFIVLALAIARPAAAQQLEGTTRPEILSQQSQPLADPGAWSGRAGDGLLNPLDAPDAGYVWKPFNRDAGNLSEDRWAPLIPSRSHPANHEAG